ncbi:MULTISPECIES: helix-turn-helix domain-containing protein [unclassified Bartonella]|uniref:helix-turn-helix domain-containing protein n=1 Tax=unclassified Bartonella TaxID=2645622 RepID=UPI0015FE40B4|nr:MULTISPECIES: helix-turn-helix domain-containing protein [unclassified Bartonella]UXN03877.1 helix-turn-helix domain-containing protein [Bartonella sp. HY406]UXN06850.1 helix-turn-helix domain-containing protein [Bartonella sp. HY761]
MTPFGLKMQSLRRKKGVSQKEMAKALDVSAAYLSALEHGRKGAPPFAFVQRIIAYFNIIWDEADEVLKLADFSHPRIIIDTKGLSAEATHFANRLAKDLAKIDNADKLLLMQKCLDDLLADLS